MKTKYKFFGWQSQDVLPIDKKYQQIKNQRDLYDLLDKIWSSDTCAPRMRPEWSINNKTLGQCSITSFLVQDIFGGEVYGVPLEDGGFHCYNRIGDVVFDLTSEQFGDKELEYKLENPQKREEHFKSEEKFARYQLLCEKLDVALKNRVKKNAAKKIVKRVVVVSLMAVGTLVLAAGGYVGYVLLSYNRIGDKELQIDHKSTLETVKVGETYKAMTYNIGFGAYSQDYTFFLDTGYDENGNATCGHYSTAKSKNHVNFNTNGAISAVLNENPDFVMFQEVDTDSTRSYHVNQDKRIVESFVEFDHTHAVNFHTAFLPYPLYDMHGYVNAGLTTLSRYKMQYAERKQYTVDNGFSKYIDLDRCFSYSIINVDNGKKLYAVNSHMSAYDEGGLIRNKQVEELNLFLKERKENGDYVVIGGDWNHDLLTYNPDFSYDVENRPFAQKTKTPDWVAYFFDKEGKTPLTEGYNVVASDNTPTCRNNDIEWEPGKTFTCCIDGFIVSDNVEVVNHKNVQTKNGDKGYDGFAFSDHDPAYLEFKLL